MLAILLGLSFQVLTVCDSPNQILRSFPPLQAFRVKSMAISFVSSIPDELYERMVMHVK